MHTYRMLIQNLSSLLQTSRPNGTVSDFDVTFYFLFLFIHYNSTYDYPRGGVIRL
ncbi:hypothetical protein LV85_00597 [Algoriphagus chordae]|uniref:Uncharacterized protein n=1 Tax=Algoriphagus chordae TaxID=237019 RepID=A0A2W7RC18_9BACT|nr:hypothetical protein LV85_00597 [Algoriphagus chordae]